MRTTPLLFGVSHNGEGALVALAVQAVIRDFMRLWFGYDVRLARKQSVNKLGFFVRSGLRGSGGERLWR